VLGHLLSEFLQHPCPVTSGGCCLRQVLLQPQAHLAVGAMLWLRQDRHLQHWQSVGTVRFLSNGADSIVVSTV
jgi:hypothetical protein